MYKAGFIAIFFLCFLFIPFTLHASVVNRPSSSLTSGLVGWWTFDGNDLTSGRTA